MDKLVGKFFHTFHEDGKVNWQGRITGEIPPDLVIVELFSWLLGDPTDEIIINRSELVTPVNGTVRFAIYSTADEMRAAYENHRRIMRDE